jgi:starch synthase
MERDLSILMVSAEAHPLAKVGGLADVMGALPRALAQRGHDVRIALPFYKSIKDAGTPTARLKGIDVLDVTIGDVAMPAEISVTKLPGSKIEVLLIGNDDLFGRDGIYMDPETGEAYPDNAERFIFFSRAVFMLIGLMKRPPGLIHCHDHQTGFIPAWLRYAPGPAGALEDLRTIFTIHNLAYQGSYPKEVGYKAGFGEDVLKPMGTVEFHGDVNMMKAGISYADTITTVSPTYAKEIQTGEFGYGLEGILKARSEHLFGILNGADYSVWDPGRDNLIPFSYSRSKPAGKRKCRQHLIERLNLNAGDETPLIGIVSRLVAQKGLDIVSEVFDEIMGLDTCIVILGLGDKHYHDLLTTAQKRFPGRVSVNLAFDEELAHQIEAGCDMFLMPSKYEPCGLNQMYSMKYGTVPIVRRTGGLADTVVDFDASGESTGFVFGQYSSEHLLEAVSRARKAYADRGQWDRLVDRAMAQDFSWERSAKAYEDVYRATMRRRVVTAS